MQVQELMGYAQRNGWEAVQYSDTASGSSTSRPEFVRLMNDCQDRKVDVVLVWKLDRFSRSLHDLLTSVRMLKVYQVRFIALRDRIDTDESSPVAQLFLNLLGSFAEFEREIIRERSKAGVQAARNRGKRFGRPKRVFDREKAKELRDKGMSFRDIANELVIPESTIRGAL